MIQGALIGAGISTLLYAFFVQFDPSMGGIWLRKDDGNNTIFCPGNLIDLMLSPLEKLVMWKASVWPINWFVWLIIGAAIGAFVKDRVF